MTPAFLGGAVVYACDLERVAAFYTAVADMPVVSTEPDHVLLECDGFRITVVDPPEREWEFRGERMCDGHDPEGNVMQVCSPVSA